MMKKIATLAIGLFAVACSSSQEPSESNFKDAIQEYLTTQKGCIRIKGPLPLTIGESQRGYSDVDVLDELARLGFLDRKDTKKEKFTAMVDVPREYEPAKTYSLSKKGQEAAEKKDEESGATFCYAEYEVLDVNDFTEPAQMLGQKVSMVRFNYKAVDLADWARSSKVLQRKYQSLARDVESEDEPIEAKAALLLTNNGWIHEQLFNN